MVSKNAKRFFGSKHTACFLVGLALGGCSGASTKLSKTRSVATMAGARYLWADARCSDGALDMGTMGFSQELFVDVDHKGALLTFDTHVLKKACHELGVWRVWSGKDSQLRFQTAPPVVTPIGKACTVQEALWLDGRMTFVGNTLELKIERSQYCRGYEATFTYKPVAPRPLSEQELVARFVARFNLRDASAVTDLFENDAVLIEPFSRSVDGTSTHHEGTDALNRYFSAAFAASDWSALRMLSLERDRAEKGWILHWEYMDSRLQQPFAGRSYLSFGGQQIFIMEIQPMGEILAAVTKDAQGT